MYRQSCVSKQLIYWLNLAVHAYVQAAHRREIRRLRLWGEVTPKSTSEPICARRLVPQPNKP